MSARGVCAWPAVRAGQQRLWQDCGVPGAEAESHLHHAWRQLGGVSTPHLRPGRVGFGIPSGRQLVRLLMSARSTAVCTDKSTFNRFRIDCSREAQLALGRNCALWQQCCQQCCIRTLLCTCNADCRHEGTALLHPCPPRLRSIVQCCRTPTRPQAPAVRRVAVCMPLDDAVVPLYGAAAAKAPAAATDLRAAAAQPRLCRKSCIRRFVSCGLSCCTQWLQFSRQCSCSQEAAVMSAHRYHVRTQVTSC